MNKVIKIPEWKSRIPKCADQQKWKRDADGWPVFHEDGKCSKCKGKADKFSTPWHAFKYQLLGYCEKCTTQVMGKWEGVKV